MRPRFMPVALTMIIAGLAGCGTAAAGQSAATTQEPSAPASTEFAEDMSGAALQALTQVAVKGRAPRTGYERSLFGDGWVDVDHNGCDTRNDILARDLTGETFKP